MNPSNNSLTQIVHRLNELNNKISHHQSTNECIKLLQQSVYTSVAILAGANAHGYPCIDLINQIHATLNEAELTLLFNQTSIK